MKQTQPLLTHEWNYTICVSFVFLFFLLTLFAWLEVAAEHPQGEVIDYLHQTQHTETEAQTQKTPHIGYNYFCFSNFFQVLLTYNFRESEDFALDLAAKAVLGEEEMKNRHIFAKMAQKWRHGVLFEVMLDDLPEILVWDVFNAVFKIRGQ